MYQVTFLLAWRYLVSSRAEKNINTMIIICFCATLLGSFSLALIMSIMKGFESATHEKLQGINADIIIHSYDKPLPSKKIHHLLRTEFPEVIGSSISQTEHALIHHDIPGISPQAVICKGLDPVQESA